MTDNTEASKSELFVVDGTNVCFWWGHAFKHRDTGLNKMSVRPLLVLLCEILEHGDDFFCVFDASTSSLIREQGNPKEAGLIDYLVRRYSRRFYRVTGSTRADSAILHHANKFNTRIITNDIYRDYRDKVSWLDDPHTNRLVQGNFQRTGLMTLEKLEYGFMEVEWTVLTRDMVKRLQNCLTNGFDWKAFRASRDAAFVQTSEVPLIEVSGIAPRPAVRTKQLKGTRTRKPQKPAPRKNAKKRATKMPKKITAKKNTKTTLVQKRKKPSRRYQASRKIAKRPSSKPKKARRRRSAPKKKGLLEWLFG